jgi:hypothetical protein
MLRLSENANVGDSYGFSAESESAVVLRHHPSYQSLSI